VDSLSLLHVEVLERPQPKMVLCIGIASYMALGHVPLSTSNGLFFLVTSEPHIQTLTLDCMWLPTQK